MSGASRRTLEEGVAEGVFLARTKSFTRRTRELPPNLQRTWDEHASRYVIEVERDLGHTTVAAGVRFDPVALFGRRAPLTIEIGSGTGEQIVAAAASHPERDYLAFEVWVPGIAKLISKAVSAGVGNIRVVEADAQLALPIVFDDAIADEVWTFFPDPWRKARHRKRR
ncbi:tRNA (guanosine(46)-N(7))-methyltransferase TrmB, partial [Schaalia hyovaginalis]|nr:tRNA (guanine-N7)-methyltransferase [Schaalia hyovaginalis]